MREAETFIALHPSLLASSIAPPVCSPPPRPPTPPLTSASSSPPQTRTPQQPSHAVPRPPPRRRSHSPAPPPEPPPLPQTSRRLRSSRKIQSASSKRMRQHPLLEAPRRPQRGEHGKNRPAPEALESCGVAGGGRRDSWRAQALVPPPRVAADDIRRSAALEEDSAGGGRGRAIRNGKGKEVRRSACDGLRAKQEGAKPV